jgi:hypothetical protein
MWLDSSLRREAARRHAEHVNSYRRVRFTRRAHPRANQSAHRCSWQGTQPCVKAAARPHKQWRHATDSDGRITSSPIPGCSPTSLSLQRPAHLHPELRAGHGPIGLQPSIRHGRGSRLLLLLLAKAEPPHRACCPPNSEPSDQSQKAAHLEEHARAHHYFYLYPSLFLRAPSPIPVIALELLSRSAVFAASLPATSQPYRPPPPTLHHTHRRRHYTTPGRTHSILRPLDEQPGQLPGRHH